MASKQGAAGVVTNVRDCEPEPQSLFLRATAFFFLFFFSFFLFFRVFNLNVNVLLSKYCTWQAEETKIFDFLLCVKLRARKISVCIKFNFTERILLVSL